MRMRLILMGSDSGPGLLGKFILIGFLVLSAGPSFAFATQLQGVSGGDFLKRSEEVFRGRLISSESFMPPGGGTILTRHTFEVSGWIKGTGTKTFEILEYGGQVGDTTLSVSHQASYVANQQYLVFSRLDTLGYRRTLGGPWGALPLISGGGETMVRLPGRHPLRDSLDLKPAAFFLKLESLIHQLEALMETLPNETK